MLNTIRTANPAWLYFAVGLVATVLVVLGVEAGYFAVVVDFFVAVWRTVDGWFAAIAHAL
jgi:hypothetical protein